MCWCPSGWATSFSSKACWTACFRPGIGYCDRGGLMLPNRCQLFLVALSDNDINRRMVSFWDNVEGFKMSCMRKGSARRGSCDGRPSFECLLRAASPSVEP
ncbi:hypothetical protein MRX96_033660 [Rhipicephalus microplus]